MREPFFRTSDIWTSNEAYERHRIPGMIVTKKGTLLVYFEARKYDNCQNNDWSLMDILLYRSENRGESFGTPIILAEGNDTHRTVNNPVMVEDKNGRIHFLYCEDYSTDGGRVLRRYSDDDGLSWSEPIDITKCTVPEYRNAFALGPGHGILTKENVIIFPVWMVPKHHGAPIRAHSPSVTSTLYSADNGESWSIGEILDTSVDVISPNETEAALTPSGEVYLNIRHKAQYRAKAYSKNGYSEWKDYGADRTLIDPQCFASVIEYNDGEHQGALIYAGCASESERKALTVRISLDGGKSFPISRQIDKDRGGYVELAKDTEARLIYLLYEDRFGLTDTLATFNYEWLIHTYTDIKQN